MSNPRGQSDRLSWPGHISAWTRWFLGWIEPIEITDPGTYELRAVEQYPEVFRISRGYADKEFLLIENRQPIPGDFDERFYQPGGVLIYHIDENNLELEGYGNSPAGGPYQSGWPQNGNHYPVALLQRDGLYELEQRINNGHIDDVYTIGSEGLYPGSGQYPNTDSYARGNIRSTGIEIDNFRAGSEPGSILFDVNIGDETPAPTVDPSGTTTSPTLSPTSIVSPTDTPTQVVETEVPVVPTSIPSLGFTPGPTKETTPPPAQEPTPPPTKEPTRPPMEKPTTPPMKETSLPTSDPIPRPSRAPTFQTTPEPTPGRTLNPTRKPTRSPTDKPTEIPTDEPSIRPEPRPTFPPYLNIMRTGSFKSPISATQPTVTRSSSSSRSQKSSKKSSKSSKKHSKSSKKHGKKNSKKSRTNANSEGYSNKGYSSKGNNSKGYGSKGSIKGQSKGSRPSSDVYSSKKRSQRFSAAALKESLGIWDTDSEEKLRARSSGEGYTTNGKGPSKDSGPSSDVHGSKKRLQRFSAAALKKSLRLGDTGTSGNKVQS